MNRLLIPLFTLLLLSKTEGASPAFYVSARGNDSNDGTAEKPVRSLARARDLVRALPNKDASDVTVYLSGVVRLTEPFLLEAQDSGMGGHNIIYTGAAGRRPVITGAVQVTGWKLVDSTKNLWAAPAPVGLTNTRQLFVDGVRAYRTEGRLPVKLTETKTGYVADSSVMAGWRNVADIEFLYTGGNALWSERSEGLGAWTEPRCPVARIEGTVITMAQPCWDNSTRRVMLPKESGFNRTANLVGPASIGKSPTSVENAYELLGAPGHWYFDRAASTIYYVPRPNEDLARADVEVPILEKLLAGEGSAEKPIHNLVFQGLAFTGATWLDPSGPDGFSEIQANYRVTGSNGYAVQGLCRLAPGGACPYGAWTKTPGNVSFAYDHQIQFRDCAFVHLGGAGLEMANGSQSNLVEGCVFTDISANGLELGGVDLPQATAGQITRDNRIANNHIYNVAAEYHGGIGLCVGYAQRTVIEHNQLDHLPYSALSLGWGGWPDKIKQAGVANFSENNLVSDNLIFDHMLLLADGSAIYTQGLTGPSLEAGEKIEGNVIHDQFGTGHGIYTDNGCKNVTARRNVIFHTNHDNWGGRHRDYYDGQNGSTDDAFLFEDNYWQQGDPDSSKLEVTLRHNHLINALEDAPKSILETAGLESRFRGLLAEAFAPRSAPEAPKRVAVAPGHGCAYVSWNPPAFEGGSPVESYVVKCSTGSSVTISSADYRASGFVSFLGLTNGSPDTFQVAARNAAGLGEFSLPSAGVRPRASSLTVPSAPQNVSADFSEDKASVHFQAPGQDGGSPIIGYACTIEPGGRRVVFSGRPILTLSGTHKTFEVLDGLSNGTNYHLELAAINAAGEGAKAVARSSKR